MIHTVHALLVAALLIPMAGLGLALVLFVFGIAWKGFLWKR